MKRQSLSQQIRARRREEKLSQSQLAARLGADVSTISRLERGARPGKKSLLPLAKFLDCSTDEILVASDAEAK